jgi:cobyrinic acid a,c-diamide synthase
MPVADELRARLGMARRCECFMSRLQGELGRALERWTDVNRLLTLSCRREFPWCEMPAWQQHAERPAIRIAMAYDEAFNCYFPDSLDALESLGAKMIDFSPLKDEKLPDDVDVVYFGCGHPEQFAERLSANQCMMQALRDYVRRGGRMYAEGGGFAYLCQSIQWDAGRMVPMVGVFSAHAQWNPRPLPPRPVEVTMTRGTWLGTPGTTLRGYRNERWQITPQAPHVAVLGELGHEHDVLTTYQAFGSRLHLNFAATPSFLPSFLRPRSLASAVR